MTPQGTLRFVKQKLGIAVLVGLRDKPYGQGFATQALARLSAAEQLALLNEAVATTGKSRNEITTGDILVEMVAILLSRGLL